MNNIMKSVTIRDPQILEILEEFKDLWYNDLDNFEKHMLPMGAAVPDKENREYYISDAYRDKIMNLGEDHNGFPEVLFGYSLKPITSDNGKSQLILKPNEVRTYFAKKYIELNSKLQSVLSTRHNALCAVYPPGGYISWHNNANASSYNIIITWSENGNGYWKHIDPYTKEEVIVKDVPGWQAKGFYFGSYDDNRNDLVYHMASTDCWRMTISYIFDRDNKDFWEDTLMMLEDR